MSRKTFKEIVEKDILNVFININEFADMHTVDGKDMRVLIDENEVIERAKKFNSTMDGVYVKQKLIYVKASDYGQLPAIGMAVMLDGKRYLVTDAVSEQGVYSITLEANKTKR